MGPSTIYYWNISEAVQQVIDIVLGDPRDELCSSVG